MAEWPGLFKRLVDLLANVTDANNTAYDAVTRGEETLRKVKDLLERLQVRNNNFSVSFCRSCAVAVMLWLLHYSSVALGLQPLSSSCP